MGNFERSMRVSMGHFNPQLPLFWEQMPPEAHTVIISFKIPEPRNIDSYIYHSLDKATISFLNGEQLLIPASTFSMVSHPSFLPEQLVAERNGEFFWRADNPFCHTGTCEELLGSIREAFGYLFSEIDKSFQRPMKATLKRNEPHPAIVIMPDLTDEEISSLSDKIRDHLEKNPHTGLAEVADMLKDQFAKGFLHHTFEDAGDGSLRPVFTESRWEDEDLQKLTFSDFLQKLSPDTVGDGCPAQLTNIDIYGRVADQVTLDVIESALSEGHKLSFGNRLEPLGISEENFAGECIRLPCFSTLSGIVYSTLKGRFEGQPLSAFHVLM